MIKMLFDIWQFPNTLISWIATRFVDRSNPQVIDGITIYITEKSPTNFGFGKFVVAQEDKIQHEYKHGVWSRRFGWLYFSPYFYFVYLSVRAFIVPVDGIHFLGAILGCFGWFFFNEWLARE